MSAKISHYCLLACLLGTSQMGWAGVIVGGTRVIYEGDKKEASISVINPDKSTPYLIQSWVEKSSAADKAKVPFIITPPLFRLDSDQENVLRIVRTGGQLPDDKESMYWLNIKSIPATAKSDVNQLQISVKTRIKLIYRPAALKKNASDAYKLLSFAKNGKQLTINNPTPYYVAFHTVKVGAKEIKDAGTVAPNSTLNLPLPVGASGQVSWETINDFGGITPAENKAL